MDTSDGVVRGEADLGGREDGTRIKSTEDGSQVWVGGVAKEEGLFDGLGDEGDGPSFVPHVVVIASGMEVGVAGAVDTDDLIIDDNE